jgi:hypothetical protein
VNANLLDAFADPRHGLEVVGLLAPLHLVQLIPRVVPRILRKVSQTLKRVSQKTDRLHVLIISDWI